MRRLRLNKKPNYRFELGATPSRLPVKNDAKNERAEEMALNRNHRIWRTRMALKIVTTAKTSRAIEASRNGRGKEQQPGHLGERPRQPLYTDDVDNDDDGSSGTQRGFVCCAGRRPGATTKTSKQMDQVGRRQTPMERAAHLRLGVARPTRGFRP